MFGVGVAIGIGVGFFSLGKADPDTDSDPDPDLKSKCAYHTGKLLLIAHLFKACFVWVWD